MDTQSLIDAIYERQPIWDTFMKDHNNRGLVQKLWDEISDELNVPSHEAKKKWKSLRENYRKELKKKLSQADPDSWEPKWAFFDCLSFLRDQFKTRDTSELLETEGNGDSYDDRGPRNANAEEEERSEGRFGRNAPNFSGSTDQVSFRVGSTGTRLRPAFPMKNKHKYSHRPPYERTLLHKMSQLEGTVEECLQQRPSREPPDPDYCFLMSLLPYLRSVPSHRKLALRRKIEFLFLKEQEDPQVNMVAFDPHTVSDTEVADEQGGDVTEQNQ